MAKIKDNKDATNYGTEVLVRLCGEDLDCVKNAIKDKSPSKHGLSTCVSTNRFKVSDLRLLHDDYGMFVHELVQRGQLLIPQPPPPPARNPDLEARCQKLKEQQETAAYRQMTRNVDPGGVFNPKGMTNDNAHSDLPENETIGAELKQMNKQLTVVVNTVLTTMGAFVFGYHGISLMVPSWQMDLSTRAALGCLFATVVFFADLYFLIKNTV